MSVLVIAEHADGAIKPATLTTVGAANKLGGDLHVLVVGSDVQGAAQAAAKIAGVSKVLTADAAQYAHGLAENVAPLIVDLAKGYSHVLAPATSFGKNVLPRVAALLDVAQLSEIVAVHDADTFDLVTGFTSPACPWERQPTCAVPRRRPGRHRSTQV